MTKEDVKYYQDLYAEYQDLVNQGVVFEEVKLKNNLSEKSKALLESSIYEYDNSDGDKKRKLVKIVKDNLERNESGKNIGFELDKDSVEAGKEFMKYVERKESENEIEIIESKTEAGKEVYGANINYKGEHIFIPLMRYDTREEVEARANKIVEELKSGELGEQLQELIRLEAIEEQEKLDKVKAEHPIVIEMSEGLNQRNLGFDYLHQLEKKVKEAGLTENPTETYIKTKVWFKDYPHEGAYSYVTILNSYKDNDFNPEKEEGALMEYLKKTSPSFDWDIYEYGNKYKFGAVYVPEQKYKEGDLVRITIDLGEGKYEYAYGNIITSTKFNKDYENFKPHWEYDVKDKFDSEKIYKDVFEHKISLREENEITEEINKDLIEKGEASLLSSEEASLLSQKYINDINEKYAEYTASGKENKYWKETYERAILEFLNGWFEEVICRYPIMFTEWLNVQVYKLPNYKSYLLNGFIPFSDAEYPNQKQFFNSLMKSNVGKQKLIGLYELLPNILIYDKKIPKQLDWELDPSSEELFSILKPIVSDDDLRPIMAALNFDEHGVTATDAMKLIFLYGKTKKTGVYGANKIAFESSNFKKVGSYYIGKKDIRYPKYENVIPSRFTDVITLDRKGVESLVKLLRTFKNASYYNLGTGGVQISLYSGEVNYFNIHYLLDVLEVWLKLGFDTLEFTYRTFSRHDKNKVRNNILIIAPNVDKFTRLKGSGSIIMAIMYDNSGDSAHAIEQTEMYLDVVKGIAPTAGVTDNLFTENNPAFGTEGAVDELDKIKEIEDMIELLTMTIESNTDDVESKDMLDLLQMTLVDLKKNNDEKFAKGGDLLKIMKKEGDLDVIFINSVIEIGIGNFKPYSDFKELRNKVKEYLNNNFKDTIIKNEATGIDILITKIAINELTFKTGDSKLKLLYHIGDIIKYATPEKVEEITKFNDPLKKISKFMYQFESFVKINNEIYEFKFKTFVINDTQTYIYSGHLDIKKPI
jgi:hypothetical protein